MKIIRSNGSGVWAAEEIVSQDGDTAILKNAIRLYHWRGALSLSELAQVGPANPSGCRFCVPVDEVQVFNILEILSVAPEAEGIIKGIKPWRP